jgi:AcrR family transcriptional regulator
MKEISKRSGIPIGNIYRYYQNKEYLYDSIVFELYSTLKYIHIHEELGNTNSDFNAKPRKFLGSYIAIATSKPTEFSILFDSSSGTKYENIMNELIEIRLKNYHTYAKNMKVLKDLDHEFIFILIKSGITSIIDICKKYSNNEKLLRYYLMKFDYFFRGDLSDKIKDNNFFTKN